MTDLLVVSKFPSVSGDIDETENNWAFHSDVPGWPLAADMTNIQTMLNAFYTSIAGGIYSSEVGLLSLGGHNFYNITGHLDGTPHGAPIGFRAGPVQAGVGDGLPGQIAVVADYHGDLSGVAEFGAGTRPRARHRGRHYLGPVRQSAVVVDAVTKIPSWGAPQTTLVKNAYIAALAAVPTGVEWCVWSRKDAALRPVIGGWVDTTPHRARRREEPTNVKVLWP